MVIYWEVGNGEDHEGRSKKGTSRYAKTAEREESERSRKQAVF